MTESFKLMLSCLYNKRSMTLVEVLVVVVVVIVLFAILFVELPELKKKAIRINCSSNVRQVGLALRAYSSEFNDQYPGGSNSSTEVFAGITNYLPVGKIYVCPYGKKTPGNSLSFTSSNNSYAYVVQLDGKGLKVNSGHQPLIFDEELNGVKSRASVISMKGVEWTKGSSHRGNGFIFFASGGYFFTNVFVCGNDGTNGMILLP